MDSSLTRVQWWWRWWWMQMHKLKARVAQRGVMEYLKPLGDGAKKDVNKMFLARTIASEDERAFWARKKEEKTKKLWESMHSNNVMLENAPEFSGDSDFDDERASVAESSSFDSDSDHRSSRNKSKKHKSKKKKKKSKKAKRKKEKAEE
ncbi:hypothetical protein PINS_up013996 [Pythium insidiosum]|nr:hypothetical protein PINS_up013996 [Pythium insidiosum]